MAKDATAPTPDPSDHFLERRDQQKQQWETLVDQEIKDAIDKIKWRFLPFEERFFALLALVYGIDQKDARNCLSRRLELEQAKVFAYGLPALGLWSFRTEPEVFTSVTLQDILQYLQGIAGALAGGAGACAMPCRAGDFDEARGEDGRGPHENIIFGPA